MIFLLNICFLFINSLFFCANCQQYDFAAEMTRQCLVPDPVGLLDCVENKVDLPYLSSWVDCTNSLGENVASSRDIINYRCKSVWEGKGLIPQVFYIKDCVIEKTGLPAKNVSAKILGAYKECESSDALSRGKTNQGVNFSPVITNNINQPKLQQALVQQYQYSTVQYMVPNQLERQQLSLPATQPVQQPMRINQQSIQQQPSSEYDFAAEITRQCLVPDPVGLLDCVENKVDLPYLSSWVVCTNSLGQNVATSADIIKYRCKSVWEGKGVIPEVFVIKDCVIERTGLPAKEVSAKVLGAYKECEKNSPPKQQIPQTKTSTGILPPSLPQFGQRMTLQNPQQQQNAEYDFAAEISRQCRVPDPVGLLDCVENKVDLPYLSSWVSCTNSLGQNVATSADVINYRCKSVWEGKGVIPEVFWIKDCVIEKTGLPARTVSAKVLGAYKECEGNSPLKPQNSQIKTGAVPLLPQFEQRAALQNPQQQQQQNTEYDFAAEISRQCRVPDPVGLLDCVENKVDLPYLSSWLSCTNSLGQNVATSTDIINYRCKSVWEGKGVIPEVFWIKDCVIEKTGLPARTVSAKVLGAYKECENSPKTTAQNFQTKGPGGSGFRKPSPQIQPMTRQYFMLQPRLPINAPQIKSLQKPQTGFSQNINLQVPQQPIQQQKILQQTFQQQKITHQPQKKEQIQQAQLSVPFQPNNAYYYSYIAAHPIQKLNS